MQGGERCLFLKVGPLKPLGPFLHGAQGADRGLAPEPFLPSATFPPLHRLLMQLLTGQRALCFSNLSHFLDFFSDNPLDFRLMTSNS